ncbi:MAG: polysaccharide biosynthesis protein [Balneolaceae bacterium]|nr:polysaccharide biosynthesis protein [Balneolaceae bacterium]
MKDTIYNYRKSVKFILDVLVWTSVTILAYLIRFDGNIQGYESQILAVTGILAIFKTLVVYLSGSYMQAWRNTSYADLFQIVRITVSVALPFLLVVMFVRDIYVIPVSIPVLEFLLGVPALAFMRATARFLIKYRQSSPKVSDEKKRILIVGAGESGTMAAREMLKHPREKMLPVAFLDDDLSKQNQRILGIPVKGTIEELSGIVKKMEIDEILIAMPSESGETIRKVVERARKSKVRYRIIPGIYDLVSGKVTINQIRNVDVADLLRRKPVILNSEEIRSCIEERKILVTGAGGSIGSEIVRQVSRFNPRHVILLGRGENSLHQLVNQISSEFQHLDYCTRICDVRDYNSLSHIFQNEKPDVVYHAAAHKHVPLMEDNPAQAILNNVIGTRNVVNLALEHGVSHFVNISTDKAVNPTSVMGASKRISEHIVEWGANHAEEKNVFVSVRFGNVLGSRGSVIPLFKDQIKRGGPVTVTHPEMVRYFMTIPEASQLVLQAGALNQNGAVYLLDMGEPVNIEQMARDLIKLSGLEPDLDIKITYSGIRPGEKLFEELLTDDEGIHTTKHEKIYISPKNGVLPDLEQRIEKLREIALEGNREKILQEIQRIVPTYSGCETESFSV